jgi:hypothetical protein
MTTNYFQALSGESVLNFDISRRGIVPEIRKLYCPKIVVNRQSWFRKPSEQAGRSAQIASCIEPRSRGTILQLLCVTGFHGISRQHETSSLCDGTAAPWPPEVCCHAFPREEGHAPLRSRAHELAKAISDDSRPPRSGMTRTATGGGNRPPFAIVPSPSQRWRTTQATSDDAAASMIQEKA